MNVLQVAGMLSLALMCWRMQRPMFNLLSKQPLQLLGHLLTTLTLVIQHARHTVMNRRHLIPTAQKLSVQKWQQQCCSS